MIEVVYKEDRGKVRCGECGKWFGFTPSSHAISAPCPSCGNPLKVSPQLMEFPVPPAERRDAGMPGADRKPVAPGIRKFPSRSQVPGISGAGRDELRKVAPSPRIAPPPAHRARPGELVSADVSSANQAWPPGAKRVSRLYPSGGKEVKPSRDSMFRARLQAEGMDSNSIPESNPYRRKAERMMRIRRFLEKFPAPLWIAVVLAIVCVLAFLLLRRRDPETMDLFPEESGMVVDFAGFEGSG